ncbi:hypothetical protein [Deinococcus planocerae]|uniref:hypothetical protein n=1 Tax=Deinococcus planocerae TaxID=1737569 RepID=UPI000C7EC101|nr:hypothetical protein [Deinococcus planocerae]
MPVRLNCAALCLLVTSSGLALAGGGPPPPRLAFLPLDRTYLGAGFTLRYPGDYSARPFVGGVALRRPGQEDALTATVLPRPGGARRLTPEAYARQFAPLNIQGAGAPLSLARLTLSGGGSAWVGTWRGSRGTLGPLYLVPLDSGTQNWLVLSATTPADVPLLDAVARGVQVRR